MPRRGGRRVARRRRHNHGRHHIHHGHGHGIHHHGIAHHRMHHRRINHRMGVRHVTFQPSLTPEQQHEVYRQNIVNMIAAEKVAAGLQPLDPACQAISIAALSNSDEIISSLTMFDPNAVKWPLTTIVIQLEEQKASWEAGSQLIGVVKLIRPRMSIPFPS